jgi:hypothetical protein
MNIILSIFLISGMTGKIPGEVWILKLRTRGF